MKRNTLFERVLALLLLSGCHRSLQVGETVYVYPDANVDVSTDAAVDVAVDVHLDANVDAPSRPWYPTDRTWLGEEIALPFSSEFRYPIFDVAISPVGSRWVVAFADSWGKLRAAVADGAQFSQTSTLASYGERWRQGGFEFQVWAAGSGWGTFRYRTDRSVDLVQTNVRPSGVSLGSIVSLQTADGSIQDNVDDWGNAGLWCQSQSCWSSATQGVVAFGRSSQHLIRVSSNNGGIIVHRQGPGLSAVVVAQEANGPRCSAMQLIQGPLDTQTQLAVCTEEGPPPDTANVSRPVTALVRRLHPTDGWLDEWTQVGSWESSSPVRRIRGTYTEALGYTFAIITQGHRVELLQVEPQVEPQDQSAIVHTQGIDATSASFAHGSDGKLVLATSYLTGEVALHEVGRGLNNVQLSRAAVGLRAAAVSDAVTYGQSPYVVTSSGQHTSSGVARLVRVDPTEGTTVRETGPVVQGLGVVPEHGLFWVSSSVDNWGRSARTYHLLNPDTGLTTSAPGPSGVWYEFDSAVLQGVPLVVVGAQESAVALRLGPDLSTDQSVTFRRLAPNTFPDLRCKLDECLVNNTSLRVTGDQITATDIPQQYLCDDLRWRPAQVCSAPERTLPSGAPFSCVDDPTAPGESCEASRGVQALGGFQIVVESRTGPVLSTTRALVRLFDANGQELDRTLEIPGEVSPSSPAHVEGGLFFVPYLRTNPATGEQLPYGRYVFFEQAHRIN